MEAQTLFNSGTEIVNCLMMHKGKLFWRLLSKLTWRFQEQEILDFYFEM